VSFCAVVGESAAGSQVWTSTLAETEVLRLQVDTAQLRIALELAQDVAATYSDADEATKRSLNQAFFTKLYVLPVFEDDTGRQGARIDGAELTEPYAFLLADEVIENLGRELEKAESGPGEPLSPTACSMIVRMAGATGLEPAIVTPSIEIRV
jgi:hypothetical protein